METTTIPSTSTAALVALRSDNYVDWRAKMKNYVLAQGLWNIVEPSMEPPQPAYDEFEAWKKKNDAALHAIQSTCEIDILFRINKISSAKIAWEKLAEIFNPTRTGIDDQIIQMVDQQESSSNKPGKTVLHVAVAAQQQHLVQELVNMMSEHDLAILDDNGITALNETTFGGNYQMAECLIRKNMSLLTIRSSTLKNDLPVVVSMFYGYKKLARYLYHQTPFQDLESKDEYEQSCLLLSYAINARELGFDRLHHETMLAHHVQIRGLLSCMCEAIATLNITQEMINFDFAPAIFRAIIRGNFEFVFHIVKANPDLLWIRDNYQTGIFQHAVRSRQPEIFSLIYGLKEKNALLRYIDVDGNNILHIAGMLEITPIDLRIAGAALQMQKEVQWFKEVESICPPIIRETINREGILRKEGERWMKETTTSCSMVGALIVTMMFAVAFTILGGNNQDKGLPILVHDKLFKIFIVTNSLSLFSSSTSVLMFLGILTSRYADEDFLISLPKKMIIGLTTLFFSIATMMVAFSAALLLMFRGQSWIIIPIFSLASVPIILFLLMQSHLLVVMVVSTYQPGIFNRKIKP
ncbi:hypothetical protein I3843_14G043200 [Carya illinoinensis]|nr:hypothetical protein I3843_14G043200 [Carya illinoinensis]